MRTYDVPPAVVLVVGTHAFLALLLTIVAWEGGWLSGSDSSYDALGWMVATMYLGLPWSPLAMNGTGAVWDLLFILGPWLNVAIHAGLWALALRRPVT